MSSIKRMWKAGRHHKTEQPKFIYGIHVLIPSFPPILINGPVPIRTAVKCENSQIREVFLPNRGTPQLRREKKKTCELKQNTQPVKDLVKSRRQNMFHVGSSKKKATQ